MRKLIFMVFVACIISHFPQTKRLESAVSGYIKQRVSAITSLDFSPEKQLVMEVVNQVTSLLLL